MSDTATTLHTYLTQSPTSPFAGWAVEMGESWLGSDNVLWRFTAQGNDLVLKQFADAGQVRSSRQFDAQRRFAPWGLAPEALWVDRTTELLSRPVLVYRWVEGEPLDPHDAAQVLALAEAVAQVHSSPAGDLRRFCPKPMNLAYFWRVLSAGIDPIRAWLEAARLTALSRVFSDFAAAAAWVVEGGLPLWEGAAAVLVHGDLRLENCVASYGAAVLVDWELAGLGDPALEAASFLFGARSALRKPLDAEWLDLYLSRCRQPDLLPRIEVYDRLLPFESLCYLLNGLRQLASEERARPEFTETAAFLSATLRAAWAHSGAALGVDPRLENAAAAAELTRLFA